MASVIWEEGQEFVKAAAVLLLVLLSLPFEAIFLAPSAVMHCEHERGRTAALQQKKKWPTNIPAFSYVIAQKKGRDLPSSQILNYTFQSRLYIEQSDHSHSHGF